MTTIYHNPRCSKSREGVEILKKENIDFKIVKYLDTSINEEKLNEIITLLKIKPIDLVRKNEKLWKEEYKHLNLTDLDLVKIMVKHPKLIERPIVINEGKAVIGRPPSCILDIF